MISPYALPLVAAASPRIVGMGAYRAGQASKPVSEIGGIYGETSSRNGTGVFPSWPSVQRVETMTDQQQLFCREYLVDRNATAACKRAHYSERSAYCTSSRLMARPGIKAYIAELDSNLKSEHILDATETLKRISKEAMDVENRPGDRLKALELLAKHHALLVERHEVGGPGDFVKLTDDEIDAEIMALGEQRQAAKPMVN